MIRPISVVLTLVALLCALAGAQSAADARSSVAAYTDYRQVVLDTAGMVRDPVAARLAQQHGLQVLDLTWEDTGRFKGSSVGPNISDMTIQVQLMDPRTESFSLHCMPVIRYPNFSDRTADVPLDRFYVNVGNEKGHDLRRVSLRELLGNLRAYLHEPGSWRGSRGSLLRGQTLFGKRDTHVLVSAQACFLPVPRGGEAEFNPVLFNYQSVQGDPAVLTILATPQGTSITIIDNVRDGFQTGRTWGQRLFHNRDGERAVLTGRRMSDVTPPNRRDPMEPQPHSTPGGLVPRRQRDMNCVLLIQVPLKQKQQPGRAIDLFGLEGDSAAPAGAAQLERKSSDVEDAVLGHGRVEGPFTELDGLEIERDTRFPIRATVQFYKATSNGVVDAGDLASIARQIERIYADADYTGSLVTEGETGRPTEHTGPKQQPPGWWDGFWLRYEQNTHISREQAMELLRKLRGQDWVPLTQQELELALRELHEY